MVNEALALQRARCGRGCHAFFTSPRLRGEVASILRAGEGESQAGSDSPIAPSPRPFAALRFGPLPARGARRSASVARMSASFILLLAIASDPVARCAITDSCDCH